MNYRKLGRTGLKVSEISLGSWLTYGNSVDDGTAAKTIAQAYELGINFFDTANVYMRGKAEEVVGEALRGYNRESYVIATKVFGEMGSGPNDRGLSRKHILEQANASLKRLGLDYVDIYYCHRFDPETPVDETLRTLEDLVRSGKVLYVGVSEWTAAQMQEALQVADKYLLDRIVVNQPQYHMFHRKIEQEIIPLGERNGISQVVFSPLAQGVLTGKYSRGEAGKPQGSRALDASSNMYISGYLTDWHLSRVDELKGLAEELGCSVAQLAIAWVLRQPNVASALVGASRPEQIVENIKASEVKLTDDLVQRIETILTVDA
ncbi:voltage-gated potassium channel [Paenibacillus sp. FSL H8-0548]|uniref:aldo/keto reductase family protein n=1 Tax=Paenibacillus sp. FSL H8-0548 TaxID=1920422 RepID=UPI00096D546F|nr:aldo/keto reductase family protein [Paenibacillus sp. FSL H8-0548]OMF38668.1 voltage-gated potassium channel [Paenibacillus sp. FSL H8-0548]